MPKQIQVPDARRFPEEFQEYIRNRIAEMKADALARAAPPPLPIRREVERRRLAEKRHLATAQRVIWSQSDEEEADFAPSQEQPQNEPPQ